MRSVILLSATLATLLALPVATAAPAEVDVTAELPLVFEGRHGATGHGAYMLQGDAGEARFVLHVEEGTLTRVIHRAYGHIHPTDPSLEVTWSERTERLRMDLQDAVLSLDERRPGFLLLASDAKTTLSSAGEALHVGVLASPKSVTAEAERHLTVRVGPRPDPFQHDLEAGLHQARATAAHAVSEGPQHLFLGEAVLRLDDGGPPQLLQAHFRVEEGPGSVYNPVDGRWTGPGTHTEYIHEHVLLDLRQGRLDLHHRGVPSLLYTHQVEVAGEGRAVLPGAVGTVLVHEDGGEESHTLSGQDLGLAGRYALTAQDASADRTRTRLAGSGDLTEVSYGAVHAKYDWTAPLVAAGLGTLLLAGLAWLWTQGKLVLGPVAGLIGYARVQGPEILQHGGRARVYEVVKAHPGAHFHELSEHMEFGASTLNYHLRVLERNGYLTRVKDGRYVRFFDRQSGEYSSGRKHAASALRNATTAAILREVLERPGVPQCDLAQQFEIAASTVNWHIRRLIEAGLVDKRRDRHYARYYVGEAWASLPHEEQARLAVAGATS